uniref:Anion exchange protein n=1 Tax=Ciona savignyi TaxID=51511 RepID=H2YXZ5_CIOSA
HRNVYVGMHQASNDHKPHKHHKRKEHRNGKGSKRWRKEEEEEKKMSEFFPNFLVLPPNQQVQFILGGEQDGGDDAGLLGCDGTPCLFTEMEELKVEDDGETIWRETARWIKFEECVEEGGDRWSKPHVATLSLHSLFELRSCIMNGVVQLDMVAQEITEIADLVLDQMVSKGHLPHDDELRERVRTALLSGHEHQGEKRKGVPAVKSVANLLSRIMHAGLAHSTTAPGSIGRNKSSNAASSFVGMASENQNSFTEIPDKKNKVPNFMKKIPTGSEASNVLIGEVDFLEHRIIAFVRLNESVCLGRLTEVPIPTRFLFILLGPVGNYKQYHEGRSIATLMADEVFHEVAYKAKTRTDLLAGIDEFLDQVTVLPPGEWDASIRIEPPKDLPGNQKKRLETKQNGSIRKKAEDELPEHVLGPELMRTGRLFGGLIEDIKRKAPYYFSDFKDCLSIQCLASFIFLYFAILTPIVTFGGLLGDATHNYLGTMESIFGGAISGIAFHLFSGQPLTIIGSTGPILVFEKIMFEICTSAGIEYISFRFWVGTWTGLICIGFVAFDASSLISYVTRYTEESFSALISLIFIYEAFKKLIYEGKKHKIWFGWNPKNIIAYGCECVPPDLGAYNVTNKTVNEMIAASKEASSRAHGTHYEDSCAYTPDAMLMSVVLFFGTFTIAMALKSVKTSRYFPTKVRSIISDFAVTIGIGLMVLFDILMDLDTSKLIVPETFRPTRPDRSWFIDPLGGNQWWSIPMAILPALLATILIFMDQQITAVIVNRKENKLRKGCGYHLDLLVVSIMLIICSIMGLPWFVAATVLSITHVNSLKMESETTAPGEAPKFLGVREQRVTGIMIFLMIGVSVFLTPILKYIPMPVLYGVFLYMGVSSLRGICLTYISPILGGRDYSIYNLPSEISLPSKFFFNLIFFYIVAALVGIRKFPDFPLFTQQDLMWLDDLMPESTKKKKEDQKKKSEEANIEVLPYGAGGTVNVPLQDGNVLTIPVSEINYDPEDPHTVNISKDMAKTAIWKTIANN